MPKLVVALQQNTPMIHFQADAADATLRATAVKPALDRFLLAIYREDVKSWMHDKTNKALDYRMTFRAGNNHAFISNNDPKYKYTLPYFGDSDGVMYDTVTMTIIAENTNLLSAIRENVAAFFLLNNFGVRATKGFGSFQVISIDDQTTSCSLEAITKAVSLLKAEFEQCIYKLPGSYRTWDAALKAVRNTYTQMKSGINLPPQHFYRKSVLSKVYCGTDSQFSGEKWWIKQNFQRVRDYAKNCPHHPDVSAEEQQYHNKARFLRAMLGLPGAYYFDRNRITVKVNDALQNDDPQNNDPTVKRFASPLIFKPVRLEGNNSLQVYILLKKIPSVMFGREFRFSCGTMSKQLDTPTKAEFSLKDFMDCTVAYRDEGNQKLIDHVWTGGEA